MIQRKILSLSDALDRNPWISLRSRLLSSDARKMLLTSSSHQICSSGRPKRASEDFIRFSQDDETVRGAQISKSNLLRRSRLREWAPMSTACKVDSQNIRPKTLDKGIQQSSRLLHESVVSDLRALLSNHSFVVG